MAILINHQPAVIKQGTSFDFISENSFFTGADSYSLSISPRSIFLRLGKDRASSSLYLLLENFFSTERLSSEYNQLRKSIKPNLLELY